MRSFDRRVVAILMFLGMAGCNPPLPALVGTSPPTVPRVVKVVTGTLSPLPVEKLSLVRITAEAAAKVVLDHERETGWPDLDVAWKDGGCVLLAWFERQPMSHMPVPPDPSAVYVVRLIGEQDASRVTWVMVEATSGELGAAFGGPGAGDGCVKAP